MAIAETGLAVYADPRVGRQSTGKPDEIERFLSGLGRGCRKSTASRQLAATLLYLLTPLSRATARVLKTRGEADAEPTAEKGPIPSSSEAVVNNPSPALTTSNP